MKRRSLLASVASVALAVTVGTSPAMAQDAPMGDGSVIRLLANPAGTQAFPPYVIQRFGLDERYGFRLEVVPTTWTSATINAMLAGEAEIAVLDWVNISRMRANDMPFVGIAPFMTYVNTIVVPSDSTATTVAELAGGNIGALNVRSFDWVVTLVAAQSDGVDLAATSQIIEGAPALMRGMLDQGRLDGSVMYASQTPATVLGGQFRVMTTIRELAEAAGLPDVPFLIYVAGEEWVAENPQNAAAFVAAYRDAIEILMTDDQVWIDHATAAMDLSTEAAELTRDLTRPDLLTHFGDGDNAGFMATFDALYPVAGEEVFGFSQMPDSVVTMEFN